MKAVILGGTKGMGRAVARLLAERGDSVFLLGRDENDLARSARDLEVRGSPAPVRTYICDLQKPETFEPALDAAEQALGQFDTVIITAGKFATQEQLEADPHLAADLLTVNFTNTVLFCESARKRLLAHNGGTLCAFSSVAGERGRKPVVIYGASKAGLSRYLEGLDHKYRAQGLRVICVKPGFVKTSMTDGLKAPPFAGEPGDVAQHVLHAIDRGTPIIYAPLPWRFIMAAIRATPRAIMRRVSF